MPNGPTPEEIKHMDDVETARDAARAAVEKKAANDHKNLLAQLSALPMDKLKEMLRPIPNATRDTVAAKAGHKEAYPPGEYPYHREMLQWEVRPWPMGANGLSREYDIWKDGHDQAVKNLDNYDKAQEKQEKEATHRIRTHPAELLAALIEAKEVSPPPAQIKNDAKQIKEKVKQ